MRTILIAKSTFGKNGLNLYPAYLFTQTVYSEFVKIKNAAIWSGMIRMYVSTYINYGCRGPVSNVTVYFLER